MDKDAFQLNIEGVENLVGSQENKVGFPDEPEEGVTGELTDELTLEMDDAELLDLAKGYENKYAAYEGKEQITARQKQNKTYLLGKQKQGTSQAGKTIPSNLLFESTATFVPQALAKNPESVVWSDNTEEGKKASNDIKTMLQYHSDVLCLRKKMGLMVWQWGIYMIAGMKHGWSKERNDIDSDVRKPANLILDPDGYVDEYGDFCGWLGERVQKTAQEVMDEFPKHADYIKESVGLKLGTLITYTEWWNDERTDDSFCFTTYKDVVLEKHKNEFFNYDGEKRNHFAKPKKPYTFLSVFSIQEQPHDMTTLIEQNIANQDRITARDLQIEKNLAHGNNDIVVSGDQFTIETAHQAADAMEKGDPILVNGDIDKAIKRIPANSLPAGILESVQRDEDILRNIYGTQGLTAQQPDENTTARGMILNQSHDTSRIGGGIGDALEQVADNIFNWWLQLYYVFYDEKRYGAIMGTGRAVEFVTLIGVNQTRQFVVSVSPNSMQPKDEITEMNMAIDLWNKKGLDPINLFKKLNYPDPMQTAKQVALWITNPQVYIQQMFPETVQNPQNSANPPNPVDLNPQSPQAQDLGLSQEPANASLSQVPLQ